MCSIPRVNNDRMEIYIDLFEKSTDLVVYFGCDTIQVDSHLPPLKYNSEHPYEKTFKFDVDIKIKVDEALIYFNRNNYWNIIVDSIKKYYSIAINKGLNLCLEPRVHESISNIDAILRLFDWVNSDNFGAVLDCGHLHAQKENIPLSVEKLGKKIFFVHASDNDGHVNEHLGIGRGNIDWEGTLKMLKKHKYKGFIAIDIGKLPSEYDLD